MITFSESLQTGIIHIGSVDAGYAVEGSFIAILTSFNFESTVLWVDPVLG